MKKFLSILLFLSPISFLVAEEGSIEALEAFSKKNLSYTLADPNNMEQVRRVQANAQWARQIQALEMLIKRKDYDQARQSLNGMQGYNFDQDQQKDWAELMAKISKNLDEEQVKAMEQWRTQVDQLVKDTRQACLTAKKAEDLDSLLIQSAPLQMRRRDSDVLAQRVSEKLNGVMDLLRNWQRYLDQLNAGNVKSANNVLRQLLNNSSSFPILSQDELKGKLTPEEADSFSSSSILAKIYEGIKSPDDLNRVLERIQALSVDPLAADSRSALSSEKTRAQNLSSAWQAAQKGDNATVMRLLAGIQNQGGWSESVGFYDPIRQQVLNKVLESKTSGWTKLKRDENEDLTVYLGRILDEKKAEGNYPAMVEIMIFCESIDKSSGRINYTVDRVGIEEYIIAQRFEGAGDYPMAVVHYRMALASRGSKWVPVKEAEAGLKALIDKDPTLPKTVETAASLGSLQIQGYQAQQMQMQQLQLQQMQNRLPSPFSQVPGYPVPNNPAPSSPAPSNPVPVKPAPVEPVKLPVKPSTR